MALKPLVSVLVPVYNAEKYLAECLDSISKQTYDELEIILIDDGSKDLSGTICDQYAERDRRIRVFHKDNAGVAIARNDAISYASGDYICFVDGDDYIAPNMCSRVVEVFKNTNADIIVFGCVLFDHTGEGKREDHQRNISLSREEALLALVEERMQNYFCNKAFKKEVIQSVRCHPGKIWEDMGTVYKAFLNSNQIYCIEDDLYYYRQHENSIVHSINEKALCDIFFQQKDRYEVLRQVYPAIAEAGLSAVALAAIRLYDRALWATVNRDILHDAKAFLKENKLKVLRSKNPGRFLLYYCCAGLYNKCRIVKHRIGVVVRGIRETAEKNECL